MKEEAIITYNAVADKLRDVPNGTVKLAILEGIFMFFSKQFNETGIVAEEEDVEKAVIRA